MANTETVDWASAAVLLADRADSVRLVRSKDATAGVELVRARRVGDGLAEISVLILTEADLCRLRETKSEELWTRARLTGRERAE